MTRRVVAVDIKREMERLAVHAACKAACEAHDNFSDASDHGVRVRDSISRIGQWGEMAGAALAYVEWQIDNPWNPMLSQGVNPLAYEREREKLWDAFMAARRKAVGVKESSNEST